MITVIVPAFLDLNIGIQYCYSRLFDSNRATQEGSLLPLASIYGSE